MGRRRERDKTENINLTEQATTHNGDLRGTANPVWYLSHETRLLKDPKRPGSAYF